MYTAEGDKVYVEQDGKKELFLTVHPIPDTMSVEEQAVVLASLLNATCT